MFFHEVHSANLLPSQFGQLMAFGQTCWTKTSHLLKQWRGQKETSWIGKVLVNNFSPKKRVRIKSKTAETAAQIEPEDVFTIQEEKDHESWRCNFIDNRNCNGNESKWLIRK